MKHQFKNQFITKNYACLLALLTCFIAPLPAFAEAVDLATSPLVTSTASNVLPNVMFILDDSGSMERDFLPEWANDSHPVTGTGYTGMPELIRNSGFNGLAYNPAITYTPPVLYNADGSLNTIKYKNQVGDLAATAAPATNGTGADSTAKPNWKAVKNDAYGILSTTSINLQGSASHYVFVPGEYCTTERLDNCVAANAPTTVASVVYDKPAALRWCNSAALTNCRSINDATFRFPRYPGVALGATAASAAITITGVANSPTSARTSVTSITVNGQQILPSSTGTQTSNNNLATLIRDRINSCTAGISGSCTIAGYSATRSGGVVTITAPTSLGAITSLPIIIKGVGTGVVTPIAFSGGVAASIVPGSNILTNIVLPNTTSYPYPGTTTHHPNRSDCIADTTAPETCTYNEEMTNYANWHTYYRTRMQSMKTSVSRAFATLDNNYRVGFTTIGNTGATDGTSFLGNNTFELAHKNTWYTRLFATNTPVSTPLRGALSKAGRYYADKLTGQVDPVQYSCQQNFAILSTDGYWNNNDESSTYGPLDLAGANVGDRDGDRTTAPIRTVERPQKDVDKISNTLADVSKYYFDTDIRDSAHNNCAGGISTDFPSGNPDVCTNNVFTSSSDKNINQHMTTFTMGLGIDGTLNYSANYTNIVKDTATLTQPVPTTGLDYYNLLNGYSSAKWPNPITNTGDARIDDLWHAAVNGGGTYFSAKNPDEIITGFNRALKSLDAKLGSAAAAATSTLNPVADNNFAYVASYVSVDWTGNLESRSINTATGVTSETANWCVESISEAACPTGTIRETTVDNTNSGNIFSCVATGATAATCVAPGVFDSTASTCKTEIQNSCTGTMPGRIIANDRLIYTPNTSASGNPEGTVLTAFDSSYATANPTYFSSPVIDGLNQWTSLTAPQKTAAQGANLINYLRGQKGFENRPSNAVADNKLFRERKTTLGDALESAPSFVSRPVFSYPYPGYSAYKTAEANRRGVVYMGTNDGMMHAFYTKNPSASPCTGSACAGQEAWAYVPSMVIPNMWKLASANYDVSHVNFVNGTPLISDVCVSQCTTASAVWKTILVGGLNAGGRGYYALDITVPATPVLLWEITPNAGKGKIKDDDMGYSYGKPIITRKADGTWVVLVTSGYNNGGKAYLYALDAATGTILNKISTGASEADDSGLAKIVGSNSNPAGNEVEYVYGGDLLGNLWRFDINGTGSAAIGTGDVMKMVILKDASGTTQPITTTPVLGQVDNKRVVFIGTGRYLEKDDLDTTQTQTQYAISDTSPAGTEGTTDTLVNARANLVSQTVQNNANGTATRTVTANPTPPNFSTDRGWYVDFPDASNKERANVDARLVLGTLIVPTIVPENTVCTPGGFGWLNFFDYRTGAGVVTNLVSKKYNSVIVGLNVIYIDGKPKVSVVTSTNPTPELDNEVPFKDSSANFKGKRNLWRELIQ